MSTDTTNCTSGLDRSVPQRSTSLFFSESATIFLKSNSSSSYFKQHNFNENTTVSGIIRFLHLVYIFKKKLAKYFTFLVLLHFLVVFVPFILHRMFGFLFAVQVFARLAFFLLEFFLFLFIVGILGILLWSSKYMKWKTKKNVTENSKDAKSYLYIAYKLQKLKILLANAKITYLWSDFYLRFHPIFAKTTVPFGVVIFC